VADLGAPLAAVQNTITGQASSHHEENVDLHDQTRAELKAQISQLAPASTKRLIVNRHAFVTVEEQVSKYFRDDSGVWACCDAAPVEGRKYCKLVYVEQEKVADPGVYYCTGQGAQKADELHNWSMLVRVKTIEECGKPTLPKSLHGIQGQRATVVNEDGDMLRVKAGELGGKVFSVRRGLVEFLRPDVEMPREEVRPAKKARTDTPEIVPSSRTQLSRAQLEQRAIALPQSAEDVMELRRLGPDLIEATKRSGELWEGDVELLKTLPQGTAKLGTLQVQELMRDRKAKAAREHNAVGAIRAEQPAATRQCRGDRGPEAAEAKVDKDPNEVWEIGDFVHWQSKGEGQEFVGVVVSVKGDTYKVDVGGTTRVVKR
jgi:hypothetical protein